MLVAAFEGFRTARTIPSPFQLRQIPAGVQATVLGVLPKSKGVRTAMSAAVWSSGVLVKSHEFAGNQETLGLGCLRSQSFGNTPSSKTPAFFALEEAGRSIKPKGNALRRG